MSRSPKEKAVERALARLTPVLVQKMDGYSVCVGMYGMGKLTLREYESVRTAANVRAANSELHATFLKRGPDILDSLLEVLEDEEDANSHLIAKIKEVYDPTKFEDTPAQKKVLDESAAADKDLLGNGEWPPLLTTPQPLSGSSTIAPPVEGVDFNPKMAYKMTARPRGVAVIINNKHFTCGMKERIGTDKDADALTRLFINLGFYTNRFDNLTGSEMHSKIRQVSSLDHTSNDCVIISVLTHGISGKLYSTDGDLIPVDDFTKYFNGLHCPSLIGKPKLFIIQACRGGRFDYGVESESTDLGEPEIEKIMEQKYDDIIDKALQEKENFFGSDNNDDTEQTDGGGGTQALPVEADMMIAYATVPGYVSWRNSEYGSWFIKAFVDTMNILTPTEHFMDIMVEVNRRVAMEFQSKGRNKQIPAPVVMLTRKLYFRPGIYEK